MKAARRGLDLVSMAEKKQTLLDLIEEMRALVTEDSAKRTVKPYPS